MLTGVCSSCLVNVEGRGGEKHCKVPREREGINNCEEISTSSYRRKWKDKPKSEILKCGERNRVIGKEEVCEGGNERIGKCKKKPKE